MNIKNTVDNYGTIAKWLHWVTAFLFLAAYVSFYYKHWFTEVKSPESFTVLQLHLSIGMSIAIIVALRIIWRIFNQLPEPEPGKKIEHIAAHIGHYALYAIMIIMPLTGYLGTGGNVNFFFLFEIPKFESTMLFQSVISNGLGMTFKEFEKPIDFIHKDLMGAWIVWLLILGHISAALYHHIVKKDRTLLKMTKGK
jgi:cytochrome b561